MKTVSGNVAVALGMACIVLMASAGVVSTYCIPNLNDAWNRLQTSDQPNHLLQEWLIEVKTFLNQGQKPCMAYGSALGFQLTMALEKTVFRLGEPIDITLILTNISNQTVEFGLGVFNNFGFDFQVSNSTNSTVFQWSNRWSGLGVVIPDGVLGETLSAGENLTQNLAWPQTCCFSGDFDGYPVSPGTYYILGISGPIYYGTNSTIETTPIQVTILPF